MVVFRSWWYFRKDLVEHKKFAPHGEKCVYIGTGRKFGRWAFMGYSLRTNRVYASVDCEFDDIYFPFRVCDQRVRGFFDTEPNTKEFSMFYDMPHATIEQIIERINSSDVPCNTAWGIEQVMTVPAEMQAVDSNLIHHMQNDELAAYGLLSTMGNTPVMPNDNQSEPMHDATIRDLKSSVHVDDRLGAYGTVPASWKDAGTTLLSKVSNVKLGEYLIGMDSLLRMPADYWPDDGVIWYVQVIEHGANKKNVGGHVFKVVLAESSLTFVSSNGDVGPWVVDLSAKQIRQGMEAEFGKGKRLEQMLIHKN